MPKATLLAPWSDRDGHPHAAGEEVDMSDEEYQAGRAAGAVANTEEPYQGQEGHYGDRTERPAAAEEPPPQPEPLKQPQQQQQPPPPKKK